MAFRVVSPLVFALTILGVACVKPVPPQPPPPVAQPAEDLAETLSGPPAWYVERPVYAGVSAPGCVGLGCDPRGDLAIAIGLANALVDYQAKSKTGESVCGVEVRAGAAEVSGPPSLELITRSPAFARPDCTADVEADETVFSVAMPPTASPALTLTQVRRIEALRCGADDAPVEAVERRIDGFTKRIV